MNIPIFLLSLLFWYSETKYFGWNALPQSPEEVICDGIAILIGALSLVKVCK